MKSLVLRQTETYHELVVYQSSNSFGDQVLLFKYEGSDGSYPCNLELSFPEGNWTEFTKSNLLNLWNVNNLTPERMFR